MEDEKTVRERIARLSAYLSVVDGMTEECMRLHRECYESHDFEVIRLLLEVMGKLTGLASSMGTSIEFDTSMLNMRAAKEEAEDAHV